MKSALAFCSFIVFFMLAMTVAAGVILFFTFKQIQRAEPVTSPELPTDSSTPLDQLSVLVDVYGSEVNPVSQVAVVLESATLTMYHVVREDGASLYIVSGEGEVTVPEGVSQITSDHSMLSDLFVWSPIVPGETLVLHEESFLLK